VFYHIDIQIIKRKWSKRYFSDIHAPSRADYPTDAMYEEVFQDRQSMDRLYKRTLDEHVRDCALIVGMVRTINGNHVPVEDCKGAAASLIEDGSDGNTKKACFMFHYALNSSYESIFMKNYAGFMEKKLMDESHVEYTQTTQDDKKEKGCVCLLGIKTFNRVITNMKQRVTLRAKITYQTKLPKNVAGLTNKRGRKKEFVYYVKSPSRHSTEAVC
jgi:hypothetical protein